MSLGPLSSAETLLWTARLTSCSLALQAAELLLVRRAFAEDGSFPWSILRRDFARAPRLLRNTLDGLLAYRPFVVLLGLQLLCALALPWLASALVPLLLLATVLLVCVRFRGSYNGGSDAMTVVVLSALSVARLAQTAGAGELWIRAALGYVAAQLALSYFVAGSAKLRQARWRDGSALRQLVSVRQYVVPTWCVALLSRPRLARLSGYLLIAFELSFPLSLVLGGAVAHGLLTLALGFHLAVALSLGLNRFVWAWLAAFPALLFWS